MLSATDLEPHNFISSAAARVPRGMLGLEGFLQVHGHGVGDGQRFPQSRKKKKVDVHWQQLWKQLLVFIMTDVDMWLIKTVSTPLLTGKHQGGDIVVSAAIKVNLRNSLRFDAL